MQHTTQIFFLEEDLEQESRVVALLIQNGFLTQQEFFDFKNRYQNTDSFLWDTFLDTLTALIDSTQDFCETETNFNFGTILQAENVETLLIALEDHFTRNRLLKGDISPQQFLTLQYPQDEALSDSVIQRRLEEIARVTSMSQAITMLFAFFSTLGDVTTWENTLYVAEIRKLISESVRIMQRPSVFLEQRREHRHDPAPESRNGNIARVHPHN